MTTEEMERAIDFIINSQAQSEIRQTRNDEQIAKLGEKIDRLADLQIQGFQELKEAQTQTARDLSALSKRVDRTSVEVETMSRHVTEFIVEARTWKPKP